MNTVYSVYSYSGIVPKERALKFGDFTLFCGVRQRNARKFVLHVRHEYFSIFNQSYPCFVALSLPYPSSLLKPSNNLQAPVVQKLDNAIHLINHYPLDSAIGFVMTYPLDGDSSSG